MDLNLTNLSKITNKKFYREYDNSDRYLVLNGGGDSGKSHYAATKIVTRCLYAAANGYKHKFIVVRKTQPAVRKSAFVLVQEKIKLFNLPSKTVKINNTMLEITIFGNQQIIFCGLDDYEKIKSIEGITGAWLEEPTELSAKDFRQLDLRIRGFTDDYMQIIFSFNPIDVNNWLNSEFFTGLTEDGKPRSDFSDVTPSDWPKHKMRKKIEIEVDGKTYRNFVTTVHSTYKDNKWTTPAGIAVLEGLKEKDPNFYKVYALGQWGVLKGLIYEEYTEIKQWPEKFETSCYGLDFGFSNNPSALVEIGITGSDLYLREHVYETGLTNPDIADKMSIVFGDKNETTIADNAEPKSITELCLAGFHVLPCKKGPDSVRQGIQKVKQYKIHIMSDSLNLLKEIRSYKWAVDKNDKPTNKPVDHLNHLMDAARYGVQHLTTLIKGGIEILDNDAKEERKAVLVAEDYDPLFDDSLYEDF